MTDERCITGLESLPAGVRGCVLTIGNFDGVHRGHRRIVETARELARAEGTVVAALTFEPPPDLVLRPDDAPERVVPPAVKGRLLREAGCNWVVTARTDRALLSLTPEEFVGQIIIRNFAPKHVVEGPDVFFGCMRSGNAETLRLAAAAGGFCMHVVDPVMLDITSGSSKVSSTLIRSLVEAGCVEDVRHCLGRDFALFGKVVSGTGRGRKLLGVPTVNLDTQQQVVPADGIYAGKAAIAGRDYLAAITIGCNPTFGGTRRSIEAFLMDMPAEQAAAKGSFCGQKISFRFTQRIRGQQKFESAEALRVQIDEDIQRVREIVG